MGPSTPNVPKHARSSRLISSSPGAGAYGFAERDLEAAGLLGVQAASAIRNALLYERIPMARVFQPLAQEKDRWMSVPGLRRFGRLGVAAAILAALVLLPVPLRISGKAEVLPERRLPITAQVEGRVAQTFVREGDSVSRGQPLAVLDDREYRTAHEDAESRYQVAVREQSRLRAAGLAAEAAMQQERIEGIHAELELSESRLDWTRVVSTIDGVVATPRVDELVGSALAKGETFCEVVDPRQQKVEVAVSEKDGGLLDVGMPVKVKLSAYPTRSFYGTVEQVGVLAVLRDEERVFLVRLHLDSEDVILRSGMTGRAKINTGAAALGRVMFRRPARWIWSVLWGWLP
jgi:RND family efflux transporter MFP subunit